MIRMEYRDQSQTFNYYSGHIAISSVIVKSVATRQFMV